MKVNAPSKRAVETVKTVIIAVLLTAIVSFIAGAKYQHRVNALVKTEVKTVVQPEKPVEPVVTDLK